jgi:hypothetical protein
MAATTMVAVGTMEAAAILATENSRDSPTKDPKTRIFHIYTSRFVEILRIGAFNSIFHQIMGKYPGVKLKMEHGNAGEFGKYYTGSAKAKQNHRKAKMMAKRSH